MNGEKRKIIVKRIISSKEEILNPFWNGWEKSENHEFKLLPTPLGRQPSDYLKYTLNPEKVGKVEKLKVNTIHNGKEIFFRLIWEDDSADTISTPDHPFVDACGIILPFKPDAPHTVMVTMGSEAFKVNVWYWRADEPLKPRNVWAKGLGTTTTSKESFLFSRAIHDGKMWHVIIGRKMSLPEQNQEAAQLKPGMKTIVAFAVWEGGNRERAGIKAFCPCETTLIIEE